MKRLFRAIAKLRYVLLMFKITGENSVLIIGDEIIDLKTTLSEVVGAFDSLFRKNNIYAKAKASK